MEGENCKPNEWKVYGKRLDSKQLSGIGTGDITIKEQISSLIMGRNPIRTKIPAERTFAEVDRTSRDTFGVPVTANPGQGTLIFVYVPYS